MTEYRYTIILHPDSHTGGFGVEVPALPGCLTQGASYQEALANAQEAILTHIEGLRADGEPIPEEVAQPQLATVRVAA